MNKLGLFAFAAQFAPRFFQIRRRTWIAVGVGLLVLFGLLIWAAVALMGWFLGQAQGWMGAAPEAARGAMEQVEQAVPGMREKLGELVPALIPGGHKSAATQMQRDVSGTDLGPVARYPGMARTYWHREGKQVAIEYEGAADYAAVLDHYAKGFAAQGYAQTVQSAQADAESHEYAKGAERLLIKITQKSRDGVSVRVETNLQ